MLWFSFYFHLVLQFIVAAPFFSHYYQVPHENENKNNFLSHRIKTETKLTTIAVSVTAAPYENKNKNSHRHLVLQYIVAIGTDNYISPGFLNIQSKPNNRCCPSDCLFSTDWYPSASRILNIACLLYTSDAADE